MSAIRDEIRAILREELAALRTETSTPVVESISLASSFDLTRFACDLLARAAEPGFTERVQNGELRFELATSGPVSLPSHSPSGFSSSAYSATPAAHSPMIHKPLVTERDLAAMANGQQHLRISRNSRLTPLARDEARRLGIRIERCEP